MYVSEFDRVDENMISALFNGRNPTQTFVEQFNKSLDFSTDVDNIDREDGEIDVKVANSVGKRIQPLQEDYIPPVQPPQQVYNNPNLPQKRVPLTGVLPPEIIESIQRKKDEPLPSFLTNSVSNTTQQYLQENVRMDLLHGNKNQSQQKIGHSQQQSECCNNTNNDALAKLAESVNILSKLVGSNDNSSKSTPLTIDGNKFEGIIKQNKKGQILYIIDEEHCFILVPSTLKKFK